MESLGSAVGQTMRSAIKAKLIELGTGGKSGYIDDELPDYVMVMVANKRSREQMTEDLSLFLENHTELFVSWLHQVLTKLQEVTLPSMPSAITDMQKIDGGDDAAGAGTDRRATRNKKEKKEKRRGKDKKKAAANSSEMVTNDTGELVGRTSGRTNAIMDAMADRVMQKTNKTLHESPIMIKAKHEPFVGHPDQDEFDIPTISEIAESAVETVNRRRELAEYAELQKRINQTKRQLAELDAENYEVNLNDSDEDGDFLNIKVDGIDDVISDDAAIDDDANHMNNINETNHGADDRIRRQPIVFDLKDHDRDDIALKYDQVRGSNASLFNREPQRQQRAREEATNRGGPQDIRAGRNHSRSPSSGDDNDKNIYNRRNIRDQYNMRPFERRGDRSRSPPPSSSLTRSVHSDRSQQRQAPSNRGPIHTRLGIRRSANNDNKIVSEEAPIVAVNSSVVVPRSKLPCRHDTLPPKNRMSSRIFVAPQPEVNDSSGNEDDHNDAVEPNVKNCSSLALINSVVKIKPRCLVPVNQQASKHLLMRAVADAQRSTALVRPLQAIPPMPRSAPSSTVGGTTAGQRKTLNDGATNNFMFIQVPSSAHLSTDRPGGIASPASGNSFSPNENDLMHQPREPPMRSKRLSPLVGAVSSAAPLIELSDVAAAINSAQAEFTSDGEDPKFVVSLDGRYKMELNAAQKRLQEEKNRSLSNYYPFPTNRHRQKTALERARRNGTSISRYNSPPQRVKQLVIKHNDSDDESDSSPPPTERHRSREGRYKETEKRSSNIRLPTEDEERLTPPLLDSMKRTRKHTTVGESVSKQQSRTPANRKSATPAPAVDRSPSHEKKASSSSDKSTSSSRRSTCVNDKLSSSLKAQTKTRTSPESQLPREKRSSEEIQPLKRRANAITLNSPSPPRRKHRDVSPIRFDLSPRGNNKNRDDEPESSLQNLNTSSQPSTSRKRSRSSSIEFANGTSPIKRRQYDNLPPLSSAIAVPEVARHTGSTNKTKERCKYFPKCNKDTCEFYHPTICKSFPNCKFGENCLYMHPKCKFDATCNRIDCNFSHSTPGNVGKVLSSHVVPVSNYKSITASIMPTMCKYFPNCSNQQCTYYHPKPCHFGRNCLNKLECNFYHFELPTMDKLKWVASHE